MLVEKLFYIMLRLKGRTHPYDEQILPSRRGSPPNRWLRRITMISERRLAAGMA
jgi:hypothetical protein